MVFGSVPSDEVINKLEKIKDYLLKKSVSETSYIELIDKLQSRIEHLQENSKLNIKIVGISPDLITELKAKSEVNQELRSHYNFITISPIENITEIFRDCSAIFFVFKSDKSITKHQLKIIDLARKRNIPLSILIEQDNCQDFSINFQEYIKSQDYLDLDKFIFPKDSFFEIDNTKHIESYKNLLIDHANILQRKYIAKQIREVNLEINFFYEQEDDLICSEVKKVKQDNLQGKEVHLYRQHTLTKIFNKINQQQQNKVLYIKQAINHNKSSCLNSFLPDSWFFELQEIIERSQVKLVKEKSKTYLYLTVENNGQQEFIHNYILDLYQHKITDYLNLQWSNINYLYEAGGFNSFIDDVNHNIADINILKDVEQELINVDFNPEPIPTLNLNKIINRHCLKNNSKLLFDYNYTQSTWFKLGISSLLGITIYLITLLYSGNGKYIGFFILFVQIINIITGQSVKKIKLKGHQKELQRIIGNKYQSLIRLIIEQITQTLITNLDKKNRQYQGEISAIAEIAQKKLSQVEQNINRQQVRKNKLKNHRQTIKMWLEEIKICH